MISLAWRRVLGMAFAAALFGSGCVISEDDDDDDGTGGTGGTGGSGGTGGQAYSCSDATSSDCQACVQEKCCAEFLECANNDTSTPCWSESSAATEGEIICTQNCILDKFEAGNDTPVSEAEKDACVNSCARGSTISTATNELYACINTGERASGGPAGDGCAVECFGG